MIYTTSEWSVTFIVTFALPIMVCVVFGYCSSGFGVIAEPSVQLIELSDKDRWIVVSSDGLYSNEERGGGGGLPNEEVMRICDKLSDKSCNEIAAVLAEEAATAGSTDDVTVLVLRLSS